MSYIRVDKRRVSFSGRSLRVTLPVLFADLEDTKKGQDWFFAYSIGGHIMVFVRQADLENLRKNSDRLLEFVKYKLDQGLTSLKLVIITEI